MFYGLVQTKRKKIQGFNKDILTLDNSITNFKNLEKFKHRFAKVLGHHIMALELPFWEQFPELKPEGLDGPFKIDQTIYNKSPFK